jgi:ligand-binding SRPBCC domain-containing protein
MSVHRIDARLGLGMSIDEAWSFFADPRNLAAITPSEMGLEFNGEVPARMYAGLLLAYTVKPLLGVPLQWLTEITHIEEGRYFVDEQRRGPYRFWHHQHHFTAVEGGVEMRDIVHYELPFGPLGNAVDHLFVRVKIDRMFAYRRQVLSASFGELERRHSTLPGQATAHTSASAR